MKSFTHVILANCLTLLLVNGCSTSTSKVSQQASYKPTQVKQQHSPQQLIELAEQTQDKAQKSLHYYSAAELYFESGAVYQASTTLNQIGNDWVSSQMMPNLYHKILLLHLKLGIYENFAEHIDTALSLFSPDLLERINIAELKETIPLISEALYIDDQAITSAILLIEHAGILDTHNTESLNEQIWFLLNAADPITLGTFNYTQRNEDALAWLELVKKIRQHQINLESQYQALTAWNQQWPNHPAAIFPPKELALLSRLPESSPSNITLALPLSGTVEQVGKAVRNGFMAAYYTQHQRHHTQKQSIRISFFDTNQRALNDALLNKTESTELIVGPLTKTNVNQLAHIDAPLPTILALNYLDRLEEINGHNRLPENLYQFGLNPDIEIQQIAKLLTNRKHLKIAFIGPENDLGFRIHETLNKALESSPGRIIESIFYKDQNTLSSSVAKLLGTEASNQRKSSISNISGINFEFEPRRRKDVDAIFMLARPQTAKQLNPLFAYHYAGDLPIYASSQIHQSDEPKDDLDNIFFMDMPWMLSQTIDLKKSIHEVIPESVAQYSRFHALGADAFSLSPRLELLRSISHSQLQGYTGILNINATGIINRELQLAVFRKGRTLTIKD